MPPWALRGTGVVSRRRLEESPGPGTLSQAAGGASEDVGCGGQSPGPWGGSSSAGAHGGPAQDRPTCPSQPQPRGVPRVPWPPERPLDRGFPSPCVSRPHLASCPAACRGLEWHLWVVGARPRLVGAINQEGPGPRWQAREHGSLFRKEYVLRLGGGEGQPKSCPQGPEVQGVKRSLRAQGPADRHVLLLPNK